MAIQIRTGEIDNREALTRLAGKARTDGIRLYRDRAGRYYASSSSEPGRLHYVTGYSCDCLGFVTHGRCKHHAALMTALGWMDVEPDPDPDPTPTATGCPTCHGAGTIVRSHSRWVGGGKLGYRDQWTTMAACPTCGSQEVDAA